MLCAYNGSMHCRLPWKLRYVLAGNRSDLGIIVLYSASEQGYLVLALYKKALLLLLNILSAVSCKLPGFRFKSRTYFCFGDIFP